MGFYQGAGSIHVFAYAWGQGYGTYDTSQRMTSGDALALKSRTLAPRYVHVSLFHSQELIPLPHLLA